MEDTDLTPSTVMLIAGGAVLFIATFLDWASFDGGGFIDDFGFNAWETSIFGLLGIFCAIIGVTVAAGVAATTFGGVVTPQKILSFTQDQLLLILSSMALLITLGVFFRGDVGIGLILALLASISMTVGAFIEISKS